MKVNIYHIELSHTSQNISGGETALVEIIKYFSKDKGINQTIITSESGVNVYKKVIDKNSANISFRAIGGKWIEMLNPFFAYYLRVIQQFLFLQKFSSDAKNVIFSHEGFLPSVIHSYFLHKINRGAFWISMYHMKSPNVFKGFKGEYTQKYIFPNLKIVRYWFEEFIFFLLTKNELNFIVNVNPSYDSFLKTIYKKVHTLKCFGGESNKVLNRYINKNKDKIYKYDLCYMGRFHDQKGIFETIDIVKKVKLLKPDVTLGILGGGSKNIESKFLQMIKKDNLEENIFCLGYIVGNRKYSVLSESKIFLFPSYYESFPLAPLEAMKCGLPVVAYNLPPLQVFKKGMVKVPILNNKEMANKIWLLLDNNKYYEKIRKDALNFSSNFAWEKTGAEIYKLIQELNNKKTI